MVEIMRVVRAAAVRLLVLDLLRTLAVSVTVGLGVLIVAVLVERIFGLALPWRGIFWSVGAAALVAGLVWAVVRRSRGIAVAREVDERAGLRESLSTAMCVHGQADAWSRNVVETAIVRARRVNVRQAIPMRAPRAWPAPIGAAVALALLWFVMPNLDVLGRLAARQEAHHQEQEIRQVKAEIAAQDQKLQDQMARAGVKLDGGDPFRLPEAATPKELRQAQMKKLTLAKDKLAEMRTGQKSDMLQSLKDMMRQLRQPGSGPLDDLSKALMRGQFDKAAEALAQLQKKLSEGDLSEADKAELKEQLQKMAEQLEKLAQDRKALEEQLKKAGLGEEEAERAARDPEALKQMLEKLQNLTPEQKEQLLSQCQATARACQAASSLSQSMSQAASGMGTQGMSASGLEGMQGMGEALSDMEMLAQELQSIDAAWAELDAQMKVLGQALSDCGGCGQCAQCLAREGYATINPWRPGESLNQGIGSGGPGRGMGDNTGGQETGFDTEKQKTNTRTGPGPIIGSRLVWGESIRGESVDEFVEVTAAAAQGATEAIEGSRIPRRFEEAVQHYFGRLQARAKATQGQAPPPPPTEDAEDTD